MSPSSRDRCFIAAFAHCSSPFIEPRQASCTHVFCAACWANHLQSNSSCPICRQEVGNSLGDADRTLKQLLDSLQVRCSNRACGCTWTGPRGNLQEHLNRTCENHACTCSARGCMWRGLRNALGSHERQCEFGDAPCMNQCGFVGQRNKLREHVDHECIVTKRRQEEERQREAERQEIERKRIEEARKEEEHRALQKLRAEQEELLQSLFPIPTEVIQLNVGGVKMSVGRKTLGKHPQSLLADALASSPDIRFPLGVDGCIFIDRNPEAFALILDWLRTSVLPEGLGVQQQCLLAAEAHIWKLDLLKDLLKYKAKDHPISQEALWRLILNAEIAKHPLDLSGINAFGCCLVDLIDEHLVSANFTDVDLTNANLTKANLTNANLTNANLTNANLTNTKLTNANLTNAKLIGVNFSGVDLGVRDFSNVDLTNADLTNANLSLANLSNANLSNANLDSAQLTNAKLRGVNFSGVDLSGHDFSNVDLTGANLSNANLTNANLTNANLTNANLTKAKLTGANCTRVRLTRANHTLVT